MTIANLLYDAAVVVFVWEEKGKEGNKRMRELAIWYRSSFLGRDPSEGPGQQVL